MAGFDSCLARKLSAPGGRCEWCGGKQQWTVILGEVYVACKLGCLPLPLEGLDPPADSERRDRGLESIGTILSEGGTVTREGDDAAMSDPNKDELPF